MIARSMDKDILIESEVIRFWEARHRRGENRPGKEEFLRHLRSRGLGARGMYVAAVIVALEEEGRIPRLPASRAQRAAMAKAEEGRARIARIPKAIARPGRSGRPTEEDRELYRRITAEDRAEHMAAAAAIRLEGLRQRAFPAKRAESAASKAVRDYWAAMRRIKRGNRAANLAEV